MIESLGWTGETVCSVFKIPKFKLQIGDLPSYDSVGSLSTVYYTDALQSLIEGAEALLTEGLGLPNDLAVEFDLDGLLRMDLASQIKSLSEAVGGGLLTINEARRALNRPAVNSGDVIFRQQQEWPIEQLANRRGGPDASAEQAKLFNIEYNKKVIDNHAQ
jgi:HK97 family phage portal protein